MAFLIFFTTSHGNSTKAARAAKWDAKRVTARETRI